MATWDIKAYTEMIEELRAFCISIGEAVCIIDSAISMCKDYMELMDDPSTYVNLNNVRTSRTQYLQAAQMAEHLARELADERFALVEYMKVLDEPEGGSEG